MKQTLKDSIKNLELLNKAEKEKTLAETRNQVDDIDKEIVNLLVQRSEYSRVIGKLKVLLNMPIFSLKREKEIFAKLRKDLPTSFSERTILRIYERILDEFRIIQNEERKK